MDEQDGSRRVRVGVIGLGRHGTRYAQHILAGDVPNAVLTAVTRRDLEAGRQFAQQNGCAYHPTADDLVSDPRVDAVVVTLPAKLHRDAAIAAAQAGKHVLCEKPIARTATEGAQMVRAAASSGVKIAAGHTMRFTSVFAALRDRLSQIGKPLHFRMSIRQEQTGIPWHLDPSMAGGGAIMEIGVHVFDTISFVSGRRVERIMCETRDTYGAGVETIASGMLWLEGSVTAGFDCAKCVDGRLTRLEAVGEAGQLAADATQDTLVAIEGRNATPVHVPIGGITIPPLLTAFCGAILDDGPVPVSADDGIAAVAACEAAYASARDGTPHDVRSR